MTKDEILILSGQDVEELLAGREKEIVEVIARAYVTHDEGQSSLPHSVFSARHSDESAA